jgi:hypothetical protein
MLGNSQPLEGSESGEWGYWAWIYHIVFGIIAYDILPKHYTIKHWDFLIRGPNPVYESIINTYPHSLPEILQLIDLSIHQAHDPQLREHVI